MIKKHEQKYICRPPAPIQSHDDLAECLAEVPSALPNEGKGAEGDAAAEAVFGRLAISPTLERLPIRRSNGSSSADSCGQRPDASEWK